MCHEHGLGYEAFGPLAGGWLAGRYRRGETYPEGSRMTQRPEGYRRYESEAMFDALEAFEREALERGVSMAGLAFAWLLGVPEITAVVVGPTRAEQLEPVREALSAGADGRRAHASARVVLVIVLNEHEVRELLDMPSCIEAMHGGARARSRAASCTTRCGQWCVRRARTRSSGSCPRTAAARRPHTR